MRFFCFSLGVCGVWAAGLWAADPVAARPAARSKIVTEVRPDMRTGKLVRSVVVAPKPVNRPRVSETPVTPAVVAPRVISPVEVGGNAPAPAPPNPAPNINALVESISAQHGLSPELVHSVIKVESNYDPNAISPKGAQGLMQLIPATARRFGVSNVFNPEENIQGGVRYLRYLLDLFNNDYGLALAAYNAGEGAVFKYGDVPPYAETKNYLVRVGKRLGEVQKGSAAAQQKEKGTNASEVQPDAPRQIEQVVGPDGTVRYVAR